MSTHVASDEALQQLINWISFFFLSLLGRWKDRCFGSNLLKFTTQSQLSLSDVLAFKWRMTLQGLSICHHTSCIPKRKYRSEINFHSLSLRILVILEGDRSFRTAQQSSKKASVWFKIADFYLLSNFPLKFTLYFFSNDPFTCWNSYFNKNWIVTTLVSLWCRSHQMMKGFEKQLTDRMPNIEIIH